MLLFLLVFSIITFVCICFKFSFFHWGGFNLIGVLLSSLAFLLFTFFLCSGQLFKSVLNLIWLSSHFFIACVLLF